MELFPVEERVPGFSYSLDFITVHEETALVRTIEAIPLHPFIFQGYEAKRKVQSYGYDYSFSEKSLNQGKHIPTALHWLIKKVADKTQIPFDEFQELLLTEYPPGAQINWHRDAFPFDVIVGVSLLSDCTFRFRPHDKQKQERSNIISCNVSRRSLYVICDEARLLWQHSIAPVKERRFSITLRTLRKK